MMRATARFWRSMAASVSCIVFPLFLVPTSLSKVSSHSTHVHERTVGTVGTHIWIQSLAMFPLSSVFPLKVRTVGRYRHSMPLFRSLKRSHLFAVKHLPTLIWSPFVQVSGVLLR